MHDENEFHDESSIHKYRTEIPNCLLFANLSPTEFLVYCHIKRIAGDRGFCFMSHKNIADLAGIGEKTVRRSLEILCEINTTLNTCLIKKTIRKKPDGSLNTCLYTIVDLWPLNMAMASQNNFGTVKLTEGVRSNRPKGTVKLTEKEEPVKKNPIKKTRCAGEDRVCKEQKEKSLAEELTEKYRALEKVPRARRPIPRCLQIPELSPKDRQILANRYPENILHLALDDAKKFSDGGEWIKNPGAYLESRCSKYQLRQDSQNK